MDQTRIGGIGNIYANDALFLAGIDPRRRANSLSSQEIKKRELGLDAKFKKLYAPDEYFLDPKFFNLKIDTTNIPPQETAAKIVEKFTAI